MDDRRAVIVMCSLAHKCHVSNADRHPTMNIMGDEWPTIDERHTLWLKQRIDAKYYDLPFLRSIWIGEPPEPERPPEFWMEKLQANQGIML